MSCHQEGCTRKATHNFKHEKKPAFCKDHAEKGHMIVTKKRLSSYCEEKDCCTRSSYGYPGEKPKRCTKHKLEGMISLDPRKCPCGHRPSFGIIGGKPTHCTKCKLTGMISLDTRICPCGVHATYGINGRRTSCLSCKTDEMIDLVSKMCKGCKKVQVNNSKYDGLCCQCYTEKGGKPIVFFGFKENSVIDYLDKFSELSTYLVSNNKFIPNTSRRADILYKFENYYLIVEIDEHQHKDYNLEDEFSRMDEIRKALDMSTYFIRFNPDQFTQNGIIISSCWKYDKEGKPCIKPSKIEEWNLRLETLKSKILETPTKEVEYLFYDE